MLLFFTVLLLIYVFVIVFNSICAFLEIKKQKILYNSFSVIDEGTITVLQPMVGGDPALEYCLQQNLENAPNVNFIWLIDDDDIVGQEVAKNVLKKFENPKVRLAINPRPPRDVSPKSWVLRIGIDIAKNEFPQSEFLAMLDDDTIIPPQGFSKAAAIAKNKKAVIGLPTYFSRSNFLSRLITGFVNAGSILTYLPGTYLKIFNGVNCNGMFCLVRSQDLEKSDFDIILKKLLDDYSISKVFQNKGIEVVQTTMVISVITTALSLKHYINLMGKWFVFAKICIQENKNLKAVSLLVFLPAILPFLLLLMAIFSSNIYLILIWLIAVLSKALLLRLLRTQLGFLTPKSDIIFEIMAELITPIHSLRALLKPNKVVWRRQEFSLDGTDIISWTPNNSSYKK